MLSFFEEGVDYSNGPLLTANDFINFDYSRLHTVNLQFRNHYNLTLLYTDIINGSDINKKYILNLFFFIIYIDYDFKNQNFKNYTLGSGNDDIIRSITDNDINNLIVMINNIQYPTLRFKAYDFISARKRSEKLKYITLALNEAINFNLKHDEWFGYYGVAMKKAASISKLNNPDINVLSNKLTDKILSIITNETKGKSPYEINYNWCFELFTFLHETQITEHQEWLPLFDNLISELIKTSNINQAKDYLDLLSYVYRKEKNEHLEYYTYKRIGDLHYELASKSTDMKSLHSLNISLLYFRKIPKKERSIFNIDEKIKTIELKLQPAGAQIVSNLRSINTKTELPSAFTNYVNELKKTINTYTDPIDMLFFLLMIEHTMNKEKTIQEVKERVKNSFFRNLSGKINLSKDGRVINRLPPLSFSFDNINDEQFIDECFIDVITHASLIQRLILVLIDEIMKKYENTQTLEDGIENLVQHSLFIPTERKKIFKKLIMLGLQKDFSTAIYLLCPQVENFFRSILKFSNISTTTITSEQEEMEAGLSTLLDKKETNEIFDENLLFEMKMLFTVSGGPNLRNEVAHGLLDDIDAMQPTIIYAWWRFIRLIANSYFCENREK
ncbi:DUF4209 domain-containing protein [Providencia rettgeri]